MYLHVNISVVSDFVCNSHLTQRYIYALTDCAAKTLFSLQPNIFSPPSPLSISTDLTIMGKSALPPYTSLPQEPAEQPFNNLLDSQSDQYANVPSSSSVSLLDPSLPSYHDCEVC